MKYLRIISFLLISIILVAFAVQNAASIPIKFLFWQIEVSTALLVLICFGAGAVMMLFFSLPVYMHRKRENMDN